MALADQISSLISPTVESRGLFLEEVHIVSPGKHRIVTCIIDSPSTLNLDQVTDISREISELLDAAPFMGDSPFTLEVTSPGVDRPLTQERHFVKNIGRLMKVVKHDGTVIVGRAQAVQGSELILIVTEKKSEKQVALAFADIKRATVEIEFNRKESGK